jgi:hypothetical protein
VSHLICLVSCGFEVVSAFCDGEEIADFAEGFRDGIEVAGGPFSQQRLSFEKAISMGLRSGL